MFFTTALVTCCCGDQGDLGNSQKLWIEIIPLDDEDACGLMVIAGEKAMLQRKLIGSNAHVIPWTKSEQERTSPNILSAVPPFNHPKRVSECPYQKLLQLLLSVRILVGLMDREPA